MERADFVVVGGGLAGAAVATHLAAAGRDVLLLERDVFPRHKLCGEFLSPESRGLLRNLGCEPSLAALGPPAIAHARFSVASGRELAFPLPGPGLGLTRYALDALLFARAGAAGARTRAGVEVRGVRPGPRGALAVEVMAPEGPQLVEAGWVVAAHGRRARLDRALGRAFMTQRHPFFGLKRHHRPRPGPAGAALAAALAGHVELHAFPGGYCGMSFVETGAVNVCMLLTEGVLGPGPGAPWARVVAHLSGANPRLGARLAALEPVEPRPWAVAQVPFVPKPAAADGLLFVGDAAGMIAPLAGDGQAMALAGAEALAALLSSARGRPGAAERARLGAAWSAGWHRRFGLRLRVGAALQARLLDGPRAERTLRAVAAVPGLATLLARLTREGEPA